MSPAVENAAEPLGRVARKRVRKINEILRVAAQVISQKGYGNTSLEEVAERLDLAKASLYHYFDSKEALFSACLGTPAEELVRRLSPIATGEGTATERLRAMVFEQVRFTMEDYPELSRLFLQHLEWPDSINQKLHGWQVEHDAIYKQVIAEGVAAGEFVVADLTVARQCLIGALSFVPFWGYKPHGRYSIDELVETIAETVLSMFQARVAPTAGRAKPPRTR